MISSWSGGKDSCCLLSRYTSRFNCKYLLNFISKEYKRAVFTVSRGFAENWQAELLGIPFSQRK